MFLKKRWAYSRGTPYCVIFINRARKKGSNVQSYMITLTVDFGFNSMWPDPSRQRCLLPLKKLQAFICFQIFHIAKEIISKKQGASKTIFSYLKKRQNMLICHPMKYHTSPTLLRKSVTKKNKCPLVYHHCCECSTSKKKRYASDRMNQVVSFILYATRPTKKDAAIIFVSKL